MTENKLTEEMIETLIKTEKPKELTALSLHCFNRGYKRAIEDFEKEIDIWFDGNLDGVLFKERINKKLGEKVKN